VVILVVSWNDELGAAVRRMRAAAKSAGIHVFEEIPPEDRIFHASIAYCETLPDDRWQDLLAKLDTSAPLTASCTLTEAELVTFDGGPERLAGTFSLSAVA
jgi:hypothetical protein